MWFSPALTVYFPLRSKHEVKIWPHVKDILTYCHVCHIDVDSIMDNYSLLSTIGDLSALPLVNQSTKTLKPPA